MDQLEDSDRAVSWGWHRVLGVGGGRRRCGLRRDLHRYRAVARMSVSVSVAGAGDGDGAGDGAVCVCVCLLVGIERLRVATQ